VTASFEAQQIQHFQRSRGLVAAGRLALRQGHAGFHCKDIDQVQRRCSGAALVGAADRLPVDRHHAGEIEPIGLRKRRHEAAEGGLERMRVEQTEHPAERIVAGNAGFQAQNQPQQLLLGVSELLHVRARRRSAQHSRQCNEQDLRQIVSRVGSPRVRHRSKSLLEAPHPTPSMIREPSSESAFQTNAIDAENANAIPLPRAGRGDAAASFIRRAAQSKHLIS
jgi:hypothetical protein